MDISIIGSNGFLSNAILRYAMEQKWHVRMYGRTRPEKMAELQFYHIDLLSDIMIIDYSQLLKSDMIVYAAGAGVQNNSRNQSENIYMINTYAPMKFCLTLRSLGYRGIFVTFGSYFEIGHTLNGVAKEKDIKESFGCTPNDYIVSKRLLTHFVDSYLHEFTHWHFILPTIYGVGENGNRLIPYTIQSILRGDKLKFTSGGQIRQYLHVSEVAKFVFLAYEKRLPNGVYNIAGPDVVCVKDVVYMIHNALGVTMEENCFGAIERDDIDMQYLCLDGTLLKKSLGVAPNKRIIDMLNEYIQNYEK